MTRVVSLLPAATEMVCALGAGDSLVGVSHQCDYPPAISGLPRVTVTPIDQARPGTEIDADVRRLSAEGRPVIEVDAHQIRGLAPDVILTQDLCQVCAVADGQVHRLIQLLDPAPRLVSLQARDLEGVCRDIRSVGAAIGRDRQATELEVRLKARIAALAATACHSRPRAVVIEWLDPLYLAGHWVPQLVAAAGGEDVGAVAGSHSVVTDWERISGLDPDLVIVAICGFSLERTFKELARLADNHWLCRFAGAVWVLDGNAFTSRAGPRVVEAAELMQSALGGVERPGLARFKRPSLVS